MSPMETLISHLTIGSVDSIAAASGISLLRHEDGTWTLHGTPDALLVFFSAIIFDDAPAEAVEP